MADAGNDERDAVDPGGKRPVIADRYEVIRELGEGSSARTLLCSDLRGDRRVAVKELHFEHLDDWKHLELFEREATVLALLDHPGIPKILDFFNGEGASTSLYIVQEFVEGASLKQRMESGPMLGQQDVYEVAVGLLDVLDYLHGRAPPVLHRDIKPSNVMIRPDGDAVLVDFGGVCFGWRPPGVSGATVVGTFGYMPPEQLVGQSGPTSDLYALGATLLHLLTGRAPNEFAFDSGRIEVPGDLPGGHSLARLIEALLRPAPRDRPQSAAAARRIMTEVGSVGPGRTAEATAPTRLGSQRREVTLAAPYGPRFVDMGSPPRNTRGEFRDVYHNLVNPLFPSQRLWSGGMHAFWIALAGFYAVMTLGVAPLVYGWTVRGRNRRYKKLFQEGASTHGRILSTDKGPLYAAFKYEFEVDGTVYVAFMEYAQELARFWGEGDTVPVLYDPHDPKRSCFVYR